MRWSGLNKFTTKNSWIYLSKLEPRGFIRVTKWPTTTYISKQKFLYKAHGEIIRYKADLIRQVIKTNICELVFSWINTHGNLVMSQTCSISIEDRVKLIYKLNNLAALKNKQLLIRLLDLKLAGSKANSLAGATKIIDSLAENKEILSKTATFKVICHVLCGAFTCAENKKPTDIKSVLELNLISDSARCSFKDTPSDSTLSAIESLLKLDSENTNTQGNTQDSETSSQQISTESPVMPQDQSEWSRVLKEALQSQTETLLEKLDSKLDKHSEATKRSFNHRDNILYQQFIFMNNKTIIARCKNKQKLSHQQIIDKIFAASGLSSTTQYSIRNLKDSKNGQPKIQIEFAFSNDRFKIMKCRAKLAKSESICLDFPSNAITKLAEARMKQKYGEDIHTNYSGYLMDPTTKKSVMYPFTDNQNEKLE